MVFAGLSGGEVAAVKSSFGKVTDLAGTGAELFLKYFQARPSAQNYFKWKGQSLDAVKADAYLQTHGNRVMSTLKTVIGSIEDAGKCEALITQLGNLHTGRNVAAADFEALFPIIAGVLSEKCGGALAGDASSGWQKLYNEIVRLIDAGQKTPAAGGARAEFLAAIGAN